MSIHRVSFLGSFLRASLCDFEPFFFWQLRASVLRDYHLLQCTYHRECICRKGQFVSEDLWLGIGIKGAAFRIVTIPHNILF